MVSNRFLSLAGSPDFRCAKCRVKPVHSSTSSSSSVILTCGRIICRLVDQPQAVSGTAASSGVIFKPDSVMMASGSSLAVAIRLTVASCVSSSVSRSFRYRLQSVATASGNSLACQRLANFARRHQVVLEVAELARLCTADVAGTQRVLHLRQRAQFVVAPVDAGVGHDQLLPARLDELGRRVGGHLAGRCRCSCCAALDGVEYVLGGRRGIIARPSRIPARSGAAWQPALADAVQEIEVLRLREPLRFGDALGGNPDTAASMAANGSRLTLASISA